MYNSRGAVCISSSLWGNPLVGTSPTLLKERNSISMAMLEAVKCTLQLTGGWTSSDSSYNLYVAWNVTFPCIVGLVVLLCFPPPTFSSLQTRHLQGIHAKGCIERIRELINTNLYVALGVGIGLLVFQILCVLLASGLAVDVHREKKFAKAIKKQERMEQEITSKM